MSFARRRDAAACVAQLRLLADWTQHPDTWDAESRAAVVAVLQAVPSVVELERLRARRPRQDGPGCPIGLGGDIGHGAAQAQAPARFEPDV